MSDKNGPRRQNRSIKSQFEYALRESSKFGQSKHLDKESKADTYSNIYSCSSYKALRDTARQFSLFLKTSHPEIRQVRELTPQICQEWLTSKASSGSWSSRTCEKHYGCMLKLGLLCHNVYHIPNFSRGLTEPKSSRTEKVRCKTMTREDYEKLRDKLSESRSPNALRSLELSARLGLRSREAACLRIENISLETRSVRIVEGAKNARPRKFGIRSKDLPYFEQLCREVGSGYVCGGVKEQSLNHSIRNALRELGLAEKYPCTTLHSVRKMYARERYQEELDRLGDSKKAWDCVSSELGHGRDRQDLFAVYVLGE